MFWALIVLAAAAAIMLLGRWLVAATPAQILRAARWTGLTLLLGLGIFLLVTDRLAWALAALGGGLGWAIRLMYLRSLLAQFGFGPGGGTGGRGGGGASEGMPGGGMSRAEALAILGLAEGASRDDIKSAHHRLMDQLHPDHGGSDYLAAKINRARDVLLGR